MRRWEQMAKAKKPTIPRPEWEPGIWLAEGYGYNSARVIVFSKMERVNGWHHGFDKYEAYAVKPGFSWDDNDRREKPNHVHVELGYFYLPFSYEENGQTKWRYEWTAKLKINDVDDGLCQIWRPLTRENWLELCRIYHEELVIPEAFNSSNLEKLGFKW